MSTGNRCSSSFLKGKLTTWTEVSKLLFKHVNMAESELLLHSIIKRGLGRERCKSFAEAQSGFKVPFVWTRRTCVYLTGL